MSNHPDLNQSGQIEKLQTLVKEVKVCMFTTKSSDGNLASRPMYTIRTDGDGCIWFFTRESADKTQEAEAHEEAWLHYAEVNKNTYVFIGGNCTIVKDRQKMEELWNPVLKAWYPEGLDTPDICLLKVEAKSAEYWNSSSSTMVNLFAMAKAIVTGTTPDMGEKGELNLR